MTESRASRALRIGSRPTPAGSRISPKEVEIVLAAIGWWIWTILAVAIWVAIALWPAGVAAREGHSFIGYFIFSLIFFQAALIVANMVSDKTGFAAA